MCRPRSSPHPLIKVQRNLRPGRARPESGSLMICARRPRFPVLILGSQTPKLHRVLLPVFPPRVQRPQYPLRPHLKLENQQRRHHRNRIRKRIRGKWSMNGRGNMLRWKASTPRPGKAAWRSRNARITRLNLLRSRSAPTTWKPRSDLLTTRKVPNTKPNMKSRTKKRGAARQRNCRKSRSSSAMERNCFNPRPC